MRSKKVYGVKWWQDDHLYRHAKFGGNRTTHVGVRVQSMMFFTVNKELPAWQLCRYCFYSITGRFFGFSPRRPGQHAAPIKVKFGRK